jgi:phosphatidylinositol glycan class U
MRFLFVTGGALLAAIALGAPLWHLWVAAGSANANFFWATNLVLALAQVFNVLDYLRAAAYAKHLEHIELKQA